MNAPEDIVIERDSDGRMADAICTIEAPDLAFLDIGTARIRLSTEHVTNGIILRISNNKEHNKREASRIAIRRSPRGDLISVKVRIVAADLRFVDPDAKLFEKTVTRVGAELIIRLTIKKSSEGEVEP